MNAIVETRDLSRIYPMGEMHVAALRDVCLRIDEGEFVAVMGPSGSGKSTLLNLIGCLDSPTSGSLSVAGTDVARLSDEQLAALRNRCMGFVFQQFNLLARTSALDNVMMPLLYSAVPRRRYREIAMHRLEQLGLADRAAHFPSQLSGGQQQRVAIARALVNDPRMILADEPTGALDSSTGAEIMQILSELNGRGITVVLVTHDASIARAAHRRIDFLDGRLVDDAPAALQ